MQLYEAENNENWPDDSEERFVSKNLQNYPPRATALASNRSSLCLCRRNSKTTTSQRRTERGQQLFEQLLSNSRKRERLLVPDLATEWFRKQKLFLDQVSPKERRHSREFTDPPTSVSCDCRRCGCLESKRQNSVQYFDYAQELRRRRLLYSSQRRQQRLGEPICQCTDPENWPPAASKKQTKEKKTVKKTNEAKNREWIKQQESKAELHEAEEQTGNLSQAEHKKITICKPYAAGCVPGITDTPKDGEVKQQRKSRSIGGTIKLECCLYPQRLCHYKRPKRHKSCACIFQADGQPMAAECLKALRMESTLLRLRKKYSLREAPRRQLDPRCYRRISPEFYSLLKSYEEGMSERYPLYGMPMRYWNRTATCCPCEVRSSKQCEPCLGDQSTAAASGKLGRKADEEFDTEELSDSALMGHMEEAEETDESDRLVCKNSKCKYSRGKSDVCNLELCNSMESNSTVASEQETCNSSACECRAVSSNEEKPTSLAVPCVPKTCAALKRRKVLNSSSSHSSQSQQASRIRQTKQVRCVAEPQTSNERTCTQEESNRANTESTELTDTSTKLATNTNGSKTVRIKCSLTNCVKRRGILGSFANMCKRALRPGRHLLYNFGNSVPKTYQQKERIKEGSQTPLFSHQPKTCCWKQRNEAEDNNNSNSVCEMQQTRVGAAAVCAATTRATANKLAAATGAAAFRGTATTTVAPYNAAASRTAAISSAMFTAQTSKAPVTRAATINIAQIHKTHVAPTRRNFDKNWQKKRPNAVFNPNSFAHKQSNEAVQHEIVRPQSPQSLKIPSLPNTASQSNTSSSDSFMAPYATLQTRVVQYLQVGHESDALESEASVMRAEQAQLTTDTCTLLAASVKSADTVRAVPNGVESTAAAPTVATCNKALSRNSRAAGSSRQCCSRQYGPGADYAQFMRLVGRNQRKSNTSRTKTALVTFAERHRSIARSIASSSSQRSSIAPLSSLTSNRKYNGPALQKKRKHHQPTFSKDSFFKLKSATSAMNFMGHFNRKFTNNFVNGNRLAGNRRRYDSSAGSHASTKKYVCGARNSNNRSRKQLCPESSDSRSKYSYASAQRYPAQSRHSSGSSYTTTQASILTPRHSSDQATSTQDELSVDNSQIETDVTSSTVLEGHTLKSQPKGTKIRTLRYRLTGNFIRPLKACSIGSSGAWMTSSTTLGKKSKNKSITFDQSYEDNVPSCSKQKELKRCPSGQSMAFDTDSTDSQRKEVLPMGMGFSSETSWDSIDCKAERIDTVTCYSNPVSSSEKPQQRLAKTETKSKLQKSAPRLLLKKAPPFYEKLINERKSWERKLCRPKRYGVPHMKPQCSLNTRRSPSRRAAHTSADFDQRWTRIENNMNQNVLSKNLSCYKPEHEQTKRNKLHQKKEVQPWSGPNREVGCTRSRSGCDAQFSYYQAESNESKTALPMNEEINSSILHVLATGSNPMAAAKKRLYKANGYAAPCSSACVIKRNYESESLRKQSQQSQTDFTWTQTEQLQKIEADQKNVHTELKAIYRRNTSNLQTEILESRQEFHENENLFQKHSQSMSMNVSQPIATNTNLLTKRTSVEKRMTRPPQGHNVFANTFDKLPSSRRSFVGSNSKTVLSESYGYPPQSRHRTSSSEEEQAEPKRYSPPYKKPNLMQPSSILKSSSKPLSSLFKTQNDVRRVNFVGHRLSSSSLDQAVLPQKVPHNPDVAAYSTNNEKSNFTAQPAARHSAGVQAHTVQEHNVNRAQTVSIVPKKVIPTPSLFAVPTTTNRDDVIYSKVSLRKRKHVSRLPVRIVQPDGLEQNEMNAENSLPMNSQLLTVKKRSETRLPTCPSRRPMPPPVSLVSELEFNTHLMEERTINPNELRESGGKSPAALTTLMNRLRNENCKISSTSSACRLPQRTTATIGPDFCARAAQSLRRVPCTPNNNYEYNNYVPRRRCCLRRMPEDPLVIAPTHVGLREQQKMQSCLPMLFYGRQKREGSQAGHKDHSI